MKVYSLSKESHDVLFWYPKHKHLFQWYPKHKYLFQWFPKHNKKIQNKIPALYKKHLSLPLKQVFHWYPKHRASNPKADLYKCICYHKHTDILNRGHPIQTADLYKCVCYHKQTVITTNMYYTDTLNTGFSIPIAALYKCSCQNWFHWHFKHTSNIISSLVYKCVCLCHLKHWFHQSA